MNIEEEMMPIDEWNKQFSCKYMQQPISFLTEENLNKLEQHCEKTIQYGNGRILEEHQVTLELIIRYRELKQELEKEKEKNRQSKMRIVQLEKEIDARIEDVNEQYVSKEKIKERIKEYYEYDKRMQNKPDWHTTKYYEAKALEKLLEK